jgi:MOSC domain-containing protein
MTIPSMELSGIFIYPVKSLRGVRLDDAPLLDGRLVGDRTWLLVNKFGRFMHMRDYPQMARVEATITERGLTVRTDTMPSLEIEPPPTSLGHSSDVTHVRLWRRSAPVVAVGTHADEWFTRALGVACRLMAFVPDAAALNVPSYEVHSSLQDATPFHLTTEESLADLNARMTRPIPMNRFRPNLVVRGAAPYAEDRWKAIAIGDTVLRWIKPCTRCVATTTDQETGERGSREPLATLARYRRVGAEVAFGHYLVADTWGERLRVGDPVRVLA